MSQGTKPDQLTCRDCGKHRATLLLRSPVGIDGTYCVTCAALASYYGYRRIACLTPLEAFE